MCSLNTNSERFAMKERFTTIDLMSVLFELKERYGRFDIVLEWDAI